jgi:hypothetical protein
MERFARMDSWVHRTGTGQKRDKDDAWLILSLPPVSLPLGDILLHSQWWIGQLSPPHPAVVRVLALADHPRRSASSGRSGRHRSDRQLDGKKGEEFEDCRDGQYREA